MKVTGFYPGQIVKTPVGCGKLVEIGEDGLAVIQLIDGKTIRSHPDFIEPVVCCVRRGKHG